LIYLVAQIAVRALLQKQKANMLGSPLSHLDTPAYCVDLELLEGNIQAMAAEIRQAGKSWRPHVKCHKIPALAHQQLRAGAIGVTAAKVSEAEIFVQGGIPDVLIANLVVGQPKLERVVALHQWGQPIVTLDHFVQAEALHDVCRQRGIRCRVVIEINIGLQRVGIRPGPDALELARGVSQLTHLQLVGIMGYEGHLCVVPDPEEKQRKILAALDILSETRDNLLKAGLCCDIVSASGTATYQTAITHPGITEVQAGGGIFADPFYLEAGGVTGLQPALRLLATVVSRPRLERAVLDVGRKSLHPDIYPPRILSTAAGRPLPDIQITQYSAEHLTLELGAGSQFLQIGDKVQLIPGYSDHTTPLHAQLWGLREQRVVASWPIAARGMIH
jgi:D-serine deaminase-like pyridoxal phosphate-dependent protein